MQAMKEILSRPGCLFLMVFALASFRGMLEAILVLHLLRFYFQGSGRSRSLVRQWLERVPLEEFLKACLKNTPKARILNSIGWLQAFH